MFMNELSTASRRAFIQGLAAACAGLVSAAALTGELPVARKKFAGLGKGVVLTSEQMQMVAAMAEVIIPQTDTPGAFAADVHGFIDHQLQYCVSASDRAEFLAGVDAAQQTILKEYRQQYWQLNADMQNAIMRKLMIGEAPFKPNDREFFRRLKALTLFGYYSSKEGASMELAYLPIPGGYDGDYKVSTLGRSWTVNN
jgi:hypothetical protein